MIRNRSVALLLGIAFAAGLPAAARASTFVQAQRVNSLTLQGGTDTFATENAFGGAFLSIALTNLQTGFDESVADGSTSWLLDMRDLADLSGTTDPSFHVGVLTGTPTFSADNPATYDGTSDLDWWYRPSLADLDSDGFPLHQLAASFTAKTLDAGPGEITLTTIFGGTPASLAVSNARLRAVASDPSPPLESSNGFPPGYLPEDDLPDALTSFESMSSGRLVGNISAASLANTQIPISLVGTTPCNENYSIVNTLLDLVVGGCKTLGIIPQVKPTQPDSVDPAAGSGIYTFSENSSHQVTACKHNGETALLNDCLEAAAYSVYFRFTTDRVILRGPCTPGSYSFTGNAPCTTADPGFFVEGSGSTMQTACPPGMTSVASGAISCDFFVTATAGECSANPVRIGVATSCTATVADQIGGPLATGEVDWAHPPAGGIFSESSCLLGELEGSVVCSVQYTPAPGTAGSQKIVPGYAGDDDHAASSSEITLNVIRRSASTAVVCKPKKVKHGKSTVCTARVADASSGIVRAPTGKVKWSAPTRFGTFSATSCRLATHDGVRSCHVTFKTRLKARGRFTVTADYGGDASHAGSSAKAHLTAV